MSADTINSQGSENNPRHIAIIMDGNGRWAQQRYLPRAMGHKAGVKAVRTIVDYCAREKIEVLTLFAFSSENWRRPKDEVSMLMSLFISTLQKEVDKLDRNGVRLRFIGDRTAFSEQLHNKINSAELQTQHNTGLTLVVAANYGGRWDMTQAVRKISDKIEKGELSSRDINEKLIDAHLSLADLPEPDLFIRTGGEQRVSNFLLWQLAYTELYFTQTLWPDFDRDALLKAIQSFGTRQRRFGHTGEQVLNKATNL